MFSTLSEAPDSLTDACARLRSPAPGLFVIKRCWQTGPVRWEGSSGVWGMGKRAAILFVEMMHSAGEAQHGDVHFETSRISNPPPPNADTYRCRSAPASKGRSRRGSDCGESQRALPETLTDSKKHPLKIHPGRAQPPHFKYSPTEAIHR